MSPAARPQLTCDIAIIGAGAAGLFCASQAAARGHKVMLFDHRKRVAEKIRISGGGRCNFTNIYSGPDHFLCQNPHFPKSALASYSPYDFIDLVTAYQIPFHEKKFGQLFCDNSAQDIIDMLLSECDKTKVSTSFDTEIKAVDKTESGFRLTTSKGVWHSKKCVIATGGLSIPKIGATGFGYDIAKQFDLPLIAPRAGLVPLTFTDKIKEMCKDLTGLSIPASLSAGAASFSEGLLFTHRGLSGPSVLQISSYWQDGQSIAINMLPDAPSEAFLLSEKRAHPRQDIQTSLAKSLPKRLAHAFCDFHQISGKLGDISDKALSQFEDILRHWPIKPAGTEGYRTAEVTLGGVDTDALSSKDMQAKSVPGLYFIGEVMDVTGHLGGHNFQWAWASAYAAARHF